MTALIRVGAIDCGTNSLRLLIADLDATTGSQHELVREMRIVRLGEGVDRTGRISEVALARTCAALDEYAALLNAHQPHRIRFCATSAARDAENADEFLTAVRDRIDVTPEVLDGLTEASTGFVGATRTLSEVASPCLVLDIGGGSTELILGDADGTIACAMSLDVGSVRLTERYLLTDPPTRSEIEALAAEVDRRLDACPVDPAKAVSVVGVAGTVTTVAAAALDLESYDRERIHHARLDLETVRRTIAELVAMPVAQRRGLGFMHPGRADVIAAGALILERVLARASVSHLIVSESDILDGIAWSCVT